MVTNHEEFSEQVAGQSPEVHSYLDEVATDVYRKYTGAVQIGAGEEFIELMHAMTERFEKEIKE